VALVTTIRAMVAEEGTARPDPDGGPPDAPDPNPPGSGPPDSGSAARYQHIPVSVEE